MWEWIAERLVSVTETDFLVGLAFLFIWGLCLSICTYFGD